MVAGLARVRFFFVALKSGGSYPNLTLDEVLGRFVVLTKLQEIESRSRR